MLRRIVITTFLLLLTAAVALGQTVTIGDGMLSRGTFNVFNSDTGQTLTFSTCLKNALARSQDVRILSGTYSADALVTVAADDVTISASTAALITIPATNIAANAFLNATGARFRLTGMSVQTGTGTLRDNQIAIQVCGSQSAVEDCSFRFLGSATTAWTMLRFGNTTDAWQYQKLSHCSFRWDTSCANTIGVTMVDGASRCNDYTIIGCSFGRDSSSVTAAEMGYCIKLLGPQKGSITANVFENLGTSSAPTTAMILSDYDTEGSHLAISANHFEQCYSTQGLITLLGGRFVNITGNCFGRNISDNGCIKLDVSTGTSAGGQCITVSDNQFHNCGKNPTVAGTDNTGKAGAIVAQGTVGLQVNNNLCDLVPDRQFFFGDTMQNVTVYDNLFVYPAAVGGTGTAANNNAAMMRFDSTTNQGYFAKDNHATLNGAGGGATPSVLAAIVTYGGSYFARPGLTQSLGTIGATGATHVLNIASGGTWPAWAAGDPVVVKGFTGAGILVNNGPAMVGVRTATNLTIYGLPMVDDAAGETVTVSSLDYATDHYEGRIF